MESLTNPNKSRLQVVRPTKTDRDNSRQNILWAAGLTVGGIALIVFDLANVTPDRNWILLTLIDLLAIACLVAAAYFVWRIMSHYEQVRDQDKLHAMLSSVLGQDYIYFRNLVINNGPASYSIDGVLLGPHGALVIQLFNRAGEYLCEGDTWYRVVSQPKTATGEVNRRLLSTSPGWQAIRETREVKAWLSVRGLPQIPVQPLVVLVRGKMHATNKPSCPVVEMWLLENFLKTTLPSSNPDPLKPTTVEQISTRLKQLETV